jgi:hypothetical protein
VRRLRLFCFFWRGRPEGVGLGGGKAAGVELVVACDSGSGVSKSVVGSREELDLEDFPNGSFDWLLGGILRLEVHVAKKTYSEVGVLDSGALDRSVDRKVG